MESVLVILSAATALLAVLLGPLVSIWIARKQIHVSVLSNNRQNWIYELRETISEYFAIVAFVIVSSENATSGEIYDNKMERLMFLNSKIRLMLNPSEDDHIKLTLHLGELAKLAARKDRSEHTDKMRESHDNAMKIAQSVLKREWVRVKQVQ